MANVIRLNNGGVIQVRTGVLQGIGPIGPRGVAGPIGDDGPQGPEGETGPMGAITQSMSKTSISASQTVAPNTDTLIAFGTVAYDDNNLITSSTVITPGAGDYQVNCWLKFDVPSGTPVGARSAWLVSSVGATLVRANAAAIIGASTYVNFAWPHRAASAETLKVYARSTDTASIAISAGAISLFRAGAGPQGAVGAVGPAGPVGNVGPQGPQGVPGNSSSGFATYADLL